MNPLVLLVLFTVPGGQEAVDSGFVHWLVIFGVFAVIATGVWLGDWLVRTGRSGPRRPLPRFSPGTNVEHP